MSGASVRLSEWSRAHPEAGSALIGRSFQDDSRSRETAERLAKWNQLEVLELAKGLELRTTSFVGRLSLGELTITINPKLERAPLMTLLRYAYGLRNLQLHEKANYEATQSAFQDLIIYQLRAEASELISRGLHRDYRGVRESLSVPRGRIDFGRYASVAACGSAGLPCIHHPRLENTPVNQALKAGLTSARLLTSDLELRARINNLIKLIGDSVATKVLDRNLISDAWRTLDRRTAAYQPALELVEILWGGQGATLDGDGGKIRLNGFLFDMNRFFQTMLSRFLHDHLEGCELEDERRIHEMFRYDRTRNPRNRNAPFQKPDFVVHRGGKIAAVLDAKYRDLWEENLPREMLYQLALYALGQSGSVRKAAILYPTTSASAREQAIYVSVPGARDSAEVALRPVNLLRLEQLIQRNDSGAQSKRQEVARELVFGAVPA